MNLRFYQENTDLEPITNLINQQIISSTALYDYYPRSLETQKIFLEEKLEKGFPIFVAEDHNQFLGFAYYSEFRFRDAYKFTVEHSIYLTTDAIGKGIGKKLMLQLISTAKLQNKHSMIGVIDSENESSILFHEKLGFEKVGFIKDSGFKFNRWLHSVFMQKIL